MLGALTAIEYAVGAAFVLLGALTARDWILQRDQSHAYLALATGSLALVALLGRFQVLAGPRLAAPLAVVTIAALLLSGYALVLFRATFIPISQAAHRLLLAAMVIAGGAGLAAHLPSAAISRSGQFQAAATLLLIVVWGGCVGEPSARFWAASRGRPAVQRARLRALSFGYAGLIAIVLIAGSGFALARTPGGQLATQLTALAAVPLLYVGFAPPRFVRRAWRQKEEAALEEAVAELLLFSPSRQVLAVRALHWAIRLVGAEAGFIAGGDGSVLAARGMDGGQAEALLRHLECAKGGLLVPVAAGDAQTAIVLPLPLEEGTGALVVAAGPFTPIFGSDELSRLTNYAAYITASLDRSILTERLTALEQTKSQFLNLASHELRAPITVLRGYLSMTAQGSLGAVPPRLGAVLPLMMSRLEDMNALVEQMVDTARLEEGRLDLKQQRTDLRELAGHAIDMIQPFADRLHPLVFESPNAEVPVLVDPDRISTILTNLLGNAIKYSPSGGEVRCRVGSDHGLGVVEVTDHGVGIAESDMNRLFTRFGRIVTTETCHIGGTGLGLHLSRELARLHGGDLTAESTVGSGSTFVLAVPMSRLGSASMSLSAGAST